jgi:hypothetical protein
MFNVLKYAGLQNLWALFSLFILLSLLIFTLFDTEPNQPKPTGETASFNSAPPFAQTMLETASEESLDEAPQYSAVPEVQAAARVEKHQPTALSIIQPLFKNLAGNYSKGSAYIDTRSMCKSTTYAHIQHINAYCKDADFSSYDAQFISQLEQGLRNQSFSAGETLIEYWNSELMLRRQDPSFAAGNYSKEYLDIQKKMMDLHDKLVVIDPQKYSALENRLGLNIQQKESMQ